MKRLQLKMGNCKFYEIENLWKVVFLYEYPVFNSAGPLPDQIHLYKKKTLLTNLANLVLGACYVQSRTYEVKQSEVIKSKVDSQS